MVEQGVRSVPDRVREACATVAAQAQSVRIDDDAIASYASGLPAAAESPPPDPATHFGEGDREGRAAFVICLNAINFGSGWWPAIRKRPGHSGYFTIAGGLTERFRAGPWAARDLTQLDAADLAAVTGQDPALPLMEQYAASLRDVGGRVLADHGGSFEALTEAASGSAVALADLLAGWEAFADVSTYDGEPVPFYKRAQITAADLNRAGVRFSAKKTVSPPSPTTSSPTCCASTESCTSIRSWRQGSTPATCSSTAAPRR